MNQLKDLWFVSTHADLDQMPERVDHEHEKMIPFKVRTTKLKMKFEDWTILGFKFIKCSKETPNSEYQ